LLIPCCISAICSTTDIYLRHPQKGKEATEMAIQKQWQRNQSHTTSTCPYSLSFSFFFFYCWSFNVSSQHLSGNYREMMIHLPLFDHQVPSCISSQSPRLHASNPNLPTTESDTQEVCPESPDSPTNVSRLQEDFCRLANNSEFMPGLSGSLL